VKFGDYTFSRAGITKGFAAQLVVVALVLIAIYALGTAFGLEEFLNPFSWGQTGTPEAAIVMFILLVADVVLPVPSSIIMTANGHLFGIYIGSLLSFFGVLSSSLLGYWIGQMGLSEKVSSDHNSKQLESLVETWGIIAVILTRPLPLLSEMIAIVAGAQKLSFRSFLIGSMLGAAPIAILYARIGQLSQTYHPVPITLIVYLLISGLFYFLSRFGRSRLTRVGSNTP
jgi:uncharacterized membrane protein YdjX (TVP38/TMEM64 family)